MEKHIIKLGSQLLDQLEKFLKTCKAEGDNTIDDVLKRFEDLKKKT